MNRYSLQVLVTPRPGLLDPQGKAIHHALEGLGFPGVGDVRVGKAIHLELAADSPEAAREAVEAMCRRLLANPVTEDFRVELLAGEAPAGAGAGEGRP